MLAWRNFLLELIHVWIYEGIPEEDSIGMLEGEPVRISDAITGGIIDEILKKNP